MEKSDNKKGCISPLGCFLTFFGLAVAGALLPLIIPTGYWRDCAGQEFSGYSECENYIKWNREYYGNMQKNNSEDASNFTNNMIDRAKEVNRICKNADPKNPPSKYDCFLETLDARETIKAIVKECSKKNKNQEASFDVKKEFKMYSFIPLNRDCKGDENNLITAKSKNLSTHPSWSFDVRNKKEICNHEGRNEILKGCNSKVNGKWDYWVRIIPRRTYY